MAVAAFEMRIRRRRRERCSRWQMLGRCICVGSALARKSKFCIIIIVEQETSWFVCSIQVTLFLLYYALHLVNCLQIFGIFFIYLFDDHWGWCGVLESTCTDLMLSRRTVYNAGRRRRAQRYNRTERRQTEEWSFLRVTNERDPWMKCMSLLWMNDRTDEQMGGRK